MKALRSRHSSSLPSTARRNRVAVHAVNVRVNCKGASRVCMRSCCSAASSQYLASSRQSHASNLHTLCRAVHRLCHNVVSPAQAHHSTAPQAQHTAGITQRRKLVCARARAAAQRASRKKGRGTADLSDDDDLGVTEDDDDDVLEGGAFVGLDVGSDTDDEVAAAEERVIATSRGAASARDSDVETDSDALPYGEEENPYEDGAGGTAAAAAVGGGQAAVEQLLQDGSDALTMSRIASLFPYTLDKFQQRALQAYLDGSNVLVCAPTGAGKTAIAVGAAAAALTRRRQCIYTTPLKALSNQKFQELQQVFGVERVGLRTGDTTVNADAPIIVMTTEILRNILYLAHAAENDSRKSAQRVRDVGCIVLDEVHYMGDAGRGTVWEEVIISAPRHAQLLCMSATVSNPEDISGWISSVHAPCKTIKTSFRPVPLQWQFAFNEDAETTQLYPLLDAQQRRLNAALDPRRPRRNLEKARLSSRGEVEYVLDKLLASEPEYNTPTKMMPPRMEGVVRQLKGRDMLPAIWFVFSRKRCDDAAKIIAQGTSLVTSSERATIQAAIDELQSDQPEACRNDLVRALQKGVAVHHAGCLPGWKVMVERLFQAGVLKLVFATETLAAGINMPARTTVINALSRRRDAGIVSLLHNELLQMAGRAGRRGFDTIGNTVILHTPFEGATDAFALLRRGPEPLQSQFSTGYGMVLNLLYTRSLHGAREFVQRSFGSYMGASGYQARMQEISEMENTAQAMLQQLGAHAQGLQLLEQHKKMKAAYKLEKRSYRSMRVKALQARAVTAAARVAEGGVPCYVMIELLGASIERKSAPALMVCALQPEGAVPGATTVYVCLSADNKLMLASSCHIAAVGRRVETTDAPRGALITTPDALNDHAEHSAHDAGTNGAAQHAAPNTARSDAKQDEKQEDMVETVLSAAERTPLNAWTIDPNAMDLKVAAGTPSTAAIALSIPTDEAAFDEMALPPDMDVALTQQLSRIRELQKSVKGLKKAKSAAGGNSSKVNMKIKKAERLLAEARHRQHELQFQLGSNWRTFQDMLHVLRRIDAVRPTQRSSDNGTNDSSEGTDSESLAVMPFLSPSDSSDDVTAYDLMMAEAESNGKGNGNAEDDKDVHFELTPLGLVAKDLRVENELWVALALAHPHMVTLQPPQLAAVVAALTLPHVLSRPQLSCRYAPSDAVLTALQQLAEYQQVLMSLQAEVRVQQPLDVDLRLSGAVEAWVSGCAWDDVTSDTSLDDGDVARVLWRVNDMLRQVQAIDVLPSLLRRRAAQALAASDRRPISDAFNTPT